MTERYTIVEELRAAIDSIRGVRILPDHVISTMCRAADELEAAHTQIARMWRAVGISTYKDAQGKSIDQLIAEMKPGAVVVSRLGAIIHEKELSLLRRYMKAVLKWEGVDFLQYADKPEFTDEERELLRTISDGACAELRAEDAAR